MVTEAEWDYLRQDRNSALRVIDKYQLTLVYAGLTDTQKSDLATYRTALLDLPAAYDNVADCYTNWPTRPSWMT
jgi:hypothetical protein